MISSHYKKILEISGSRSSGGNVFDKYDIIEKLTKGPTDGKIGSVSKIKIKSKVIIKRNIRASISRISKNIEQAATGSSNSKDDHHHHHHHHGGGGGNGMSGKQKGSGHGNHGDEDDIVIESDYYALKTIFMDTILPASVNGLKQEITILKSCINHPNIVHLHEVYNVKNNVYCVFEYCDGGDLFSFTPYTEQEAARITSELLSAVKQLHDYKMLHRDIKFKNIMFANNSRDSPIKLINFGLSTKFRADQRDVMDEGVSRIYHMSPEALQGDYTPASDVWSVGVVLYMLLSSTMPFYHKREASVISMIMRGDYKKMGGSANLFWKDVSEESKQMVSELLKVDEKKRLTILEAIRHPWLKKHNILNNRLLSIEDLQQIGKSLLKFKTHASPLKKLALNIIARNASVKHFSVLRKVFDAWDTEKDGSLTFLEFKQSLHGLNYEEATIQEIFESMDMDKRGEISHTEFLAATIEYCGYLEEEFILEVFDELDISKLGHISRSNVKQLLNCKSDYAKEVEEVFREFDTNDDDLITYLEFRKGFAINYVEE